MPHVEWTEVTGDRSYGYTRDALWMRISLPHAMPQTVYLTDYHGVDVFEAYVVPADGSARAPASSYYQGASGWAVERYRPGAEVDSYGTSTIRLAPPEDGPWELYVRVRSTSSLAARFFLETVPEHDRRNTLASRLQGIAVGSNLLLLVLAFLLAIRVCGRIYWTYLWSVLALLIMTTYLTGVGPLVYWRSAPTLTIVVGLLHVPIVVVALAEFATSYLHTRETAPLLHRVLRALQVLVAAVVVLVAFLEPQRAFLLVSWFLLPVPIVFVVFLAAAAVRRIPGSGPLAMGVFAMILAAVLMFLATRGQPASNELTMWVSALVPLGFSAILTFALFERLDRSRSIEASGRRTAEADARRMRDRMLVDDRLRSLASMAGSVSHELKTPLSVAATAGAHLSTLTDELGSLTVQDAVEPAQVQPLLDEAREAIRLIRSSTDHGLEVAAGFRVFASDQVRPTVQRTDVAAYLATLRPALDIRFKGVVHSLRIECADNVEVVTVPGFLGQVVINLVNNALAHAFPTGEPGLVEISCTPDPADEYAVTIAVCDDGAGIPHELIARVVEPHVTTASANGGSGLGLAIVKTLVEDELDGSFALASAPGSGTQATIRLPDLTQEPSKGKTTIEEHA